MRKANVITALSLTVVMLVAMTGSVLAVESIGRSPGVLTLNPDESGIFTVTVMPETTTGSGYFGVEISPAQSQFGIVIRDSSGGILASGDGSSAVSAGSVSYAAYEQKTFYADVTNNGAPEGNYSAKFVAYDGEQEFTEGSIKAKLTSSQIPEFATIAIPVAAILGLFMFFNYRKRGKE